eukprot:TRINITY_DN0_c481_g1_i2.p1 TRINITY_DN0_c481_g1~~TRINITY_DN0_c481_g1_i2.p1  ORF type:complete len:186 (-),score=57.62 TRINITY_DN0_c481_g1_i2:73-630(-)
MCIRDSFELVLIRKQTDGAYKPELRRNYKNVFNAITSIQQNEGKNAILKGALPNVLRSIILNATMTAPFDYLNERMYIAFGDTSYNRPCALLFAALFGTTLSLPFDNLKTRLQLHWNDPKRDRLQYNGIFRMIKEIIAVEGVTGFFVGYYPYYIKTALYGLFTIYTIDAINSASKRRAGLEEWQI